MNVHTQGMHIYCTNNSTIPLLRHTYEYTHTVYTWRTAHCTSRPCSGQRSWSTDQFLSRASMVHSRLNGRKQPLGSKSLEKSTLFQHPPHMFCRKVFRKCSIYWIRSSATSWLPVVSYIYMPCTLACQPLQPQQKRAWFHLQTASAWIWLSGFTERTNQMAERVQSSYMMYK